jgi:hypothetical protein
LVRAHAGAVGWRNCGRSGRAAVGIGGGRRLTGQDHRIRGRQRLGRQQRRFRHRLLAGAGIRIGGRRFGPGRRLALLLFLAAVTSSLSMLQPGIAFLEEALNIGRKESVAILGFITAMGSAFVVYFSKDLKALDTLDFWVGTFLIFILATSQIIVFSWRFGVEKGLAEAAQGSVFGIPRVFVPVMKFISPLFLLTVFALWMLTNVFGISFSGGEPEFSGYVRDLFIDPEPVAILAVGLVGLFALFVALLASRARAFSHQKGGNP